MSEPVKDGDHRLIPIGPERGEYKEYSRTRSGWTIYNNDDASFAKRWKITHPMFGERYFAQHREILVWTLEHMREQFKLHPENFKLTPGPEAMKEIMPLFEPKPKKKGRRR